jgi:Mn2+/Fe2+ NRAMP family transporter
MRKVFLVSAMLYLVYVVSGVLARPDWGMALHGAVVPTMKLSSEYLVIFIAAVGTTITPWGQFFIQSYIVDRGMSVRDLKFARGDVYFGAFLTDFIAVFIIVACAATIWATGGTITDAKDAALALRPLAGGFAATLFAFGLANASLLGAFILPLSSAYSTCEAFGWETGMDRSPREAPQFYGLFTFFIVAATAVVLVPGVPLVKMMFLPAALNGILLPIILIYVMKIANDKEIMGEHVNGPLRNVFAWSTVAFLIALTTALLVAMAMGLA